MNQSGNKKLCRHFFVNGLVQGVFYRSWTQSKAMELNLTGWARNLSDGRVEVMAYGDKKNLEAFEKLLWQGPTSATVTHVETLEEPGNKNFKNFEVLR